MGPAAAAAINRGLPQRAYIDAGMMRRGGSMGMQSQNSKALGCLCGPGDPGFLGDIAPPIVKIGPVAARIIAMRNSGTSPKLAMLDALARLNMNGVTHITPEIHMQLAAGLQPQAVGTTNLKGFFGALGLAPIIGAGVTGAGVGGSAIGAAAAGAAGIGAGLAVGQTLIPIPVVGAVIGAAIFEAVHLMQRHVGSAEASWTAPGFYASLQSHAGRDYDEHQFSEAFKGMMDTGNNIIPGCGADRHKSPDCFLGPMANVIAQGYLSKAVPLSATTADVFNIAVKPWLASGAGGMVNYTTLAKEPTQLLMMQAATDRYLAGQAMTRGDMASYGNVGAHTPSLLAALQPLIAQMTPTTTTPSAAPAAPAAQAPAPAAGYTQPTSNAPAPAPDTGTYPPQQTLPAPIANLPAQSGPAITYTGGGGPAVGYAQPVLGPTGLPAVQTASIGGGLPSWAMLAIAAIGLGFVFFRAEPVKSAPNI